MIDGLLLDTHTQLWLEAAEGLASGARERIAAAIDANALFISDISVWEIGVAQLKRSPSHRPYLAGFTPEQCTKRFASRFGAARLPLSRDVLAEAALVPPMLGYGDPGDCFLVATARVHNLALMTHDQRILQVADDRPGYLATIPC